MSKSGWAHWQILVYLAFGLCLEALLGFRASAYLEAPFRRELWRLAHAHGILMPLIWIAFHNSRGNHCSTSQKMAVVGAVLMPLGFFLGGLAPTETDPFIGIWLAPLGGFIYLFGLAAGLFMERETGNRTAVVEKRPRK